MSKIKTLLRNINYLTKHSLWDQREEDIVFLTDKILDDAIYEYGLQPVGYNFLKVMDKMESLDFITTNPKSYVRICDGEINYMKGYSQPFQEYNSEVAKVLHDYLASDDMNITVGINKNYFRSLHSIRNNAYDRRYAYELRQYLRNECNYEKQYIDGAVTFWNFGEHTKEASVFWGRWKKAFENKKIAIVCGSGILDKLQYDVFELCEKRVYIYGPKKNAWIERDKILSEIFSSVETDYIICFILGMAGKAMIKDVVQKGYIAWDIGHLAKSYDTYMKNVPYSEENVRNFYAPD